jgi:hypothetical protein
MYTTPSCTIGFAANDPVEKTPAAAFPVSLNVQAGASSATFADEIVEPAASRVFARSAFEYSHEPGAALAARLVVPALCVTRQPSVGVLAPQAATSDPAAVTSSRLSVARVRKSVSSHSILP